MPATTADDAGTLGFGIGTGTGANREDLLDLITNIDPWDTPLVTQMPKMRANGITHAWLYETLVATSTAGAVEGADWAFSTATTRPTRDSNVCVIVRKDIQISESQRAVNSAGFRDAYQREIVKATREIARNMESLFFQTYATAVTTGATDAARALKGIYSYTNPTNTAVALRTDLSTATAATASALNVTTFNRAYETAFNNGSNPEMAFVQPNLKRQISQFVAPQQNRNIAAVEKRLVNSVDVYDSDFGPIQIVTERWLNTIPSSNSATATATASSSAFANVYGRVVFITQALTRIAYLRPVMHTFVGKRGDSVAGMVAGEFTYEFLNPSANFSIYGALYV